MKPLIRRKNYKAAEPFETINKIKTILNKCNINTIENHFKSLANFPSCRISIGGDKLELLDIGSNGKGMTTSYAMASGYAELLERLQNNALITFYHEYPQLVNLTP